MYPLLGLEGTAALPNPKTHSRVSTRRPPPARCRSAVCLGAIRVDGYITSPYGEIQKVFVGAGHPAGPGWIYKSGG